MNPLTRRIQSYVVSNLTLKQYIQDNGFPNEIARIILEIFYELMEWTLFCQPNYVIFMIEDDVFTWGRWGLHPRKPSRFIPAVQSPQRILGDIQRKLIFIDSLRIEHNYVCKSALGDNNIILSGHDYDDKEASCEMTVPNVRSIFWGYYTAFVLTDSGDVYSCGVNNYGQLGLDSSEPQKSLVKINFPDESKIVKVTCGVKHTLFLTETGTVYACGSNDVGQLGIEDDRELASHTCMKRLVRITLSHVIDICCGDLYSLAITIDGNIHAWGNNHAGQLGLGDTINRWTPQLVTFPEF
jgi:hypothetical protein